MTDDEAIELVRALLHWEGGVNGRRHKCKCPECTALRRVLRLARQQTET